VNKLVISNLVNRPVRSLISITAIAVEVTLILVIVGLLLGILDDSKRRQAGIGADVIVQPPGASAIGLMSSAPVSVRYGDLIRPLPHVTAVTPLITQLNTADAVEMINGIDLKSFEEVGGPLRYVEGGPFKEHDDMLIDDFLATSKNLHVGSQIKVLNHTFDVSGVVAHGRGARKFVQITTLQDLLGAQGRVSIFYVKADRPENAQLILDEIKNMNGMQQFTVRTMEEWLSMMTPENIPMFSTAIYVVNAVAMIIGFIVIFQAMYTAVMERTRELGKRTRELRQSYEELRAAQEELELALVVL